MIVARRQPDNLIGSILLLLTFAVVSSSDAGQYAALRYRDGYHGLPLGRVAVFLAPGAWVWFVVLLPLPIALFPDALLGRRWRWLLRAYIGFAAAFVASIVWQDASGIVARHIRVDGSGQLSSFGAEGSPSIADVMTILLYLAFVLAWITRLVLSYRHSAGDYRQQLKWLLSGAVVGTVGITLAVSTSGGTSLLALVGGIGFLVSLVALPVGLGVGILKYRLYDIDRLISRTVSYLIITGLLVGVFIGIVALTTQVLPFSSPVGVAASTLRRRRALQPAPTPRATARRPALQPRPLRRRGDRRGLHAALRDAVDLDTVRHELLAAVDGAVKPSHASLWIRSRDRVAL